MTIRVLICNRTYLYAEGLRLILEKDGGFLVTGAVCVEQDLDHLEALDPDLILSDAAIFPWVAGRGKRILLIWDSKEQQLLPPFGSLKAMIDQGLAGILDGKTDPALLCKAVAKVHAGELWIDHQLIRISLCDDFTHPNPQLSRREAEVLRHICAGSSNKEIAEKLFISEQTVKSHLNHLFKKFGVTSRLQLALRVPSGK
jgi:DNA-binding NarL/FixJ family response regulator